MYELKPCPFCGEDANMIETELGVVYNDYYVAFCTNCPANMAHFESVEEAIKAWNTRKEECAG